MADFTLVVGVDTSLSFTEMQSGINEIVSKLNANPPKIKVKFDEASLKTMQSQLNALQANINATAGRSPVNTASLSEVAAKAGQATSAVQNMNKAISSTSAAAKSASEAERQLKKIADAATQARALLNKNMEASGSASYQKLNAELTKLETILQTCGGDSTKLSAALKSAGIDGESAVTRLNTAMATLKNELQTTGTQGTASLRQITEMYAQMQALLNSNPQMAGTAQFAALSAQVAAFRGIIEACGGDASMLESALHSAGLNGATALETAKMAMASFKAEIASATASERQMAATERAREAALKSYSSAIIQGEAALRNWTAAENSKNESSRVAYQRLKDSVDAMRSAKTAYDSGTGSIENLRAKTNAYKATLKDTERTIRSNGDATKSFSERMGGLAKKFGAWFSVTHVIMLAVRAVRQMVKASVELDSAMTQMQIVTKASASEMEAFGDAAAKVAKRTASTITDVVDSATTYARLGYTMGESTQLAEFTAMLQNVGNIDVSDAQDAITSIIKAYDIDASQIESVMDKLVEVGNHFPISVSQIAEGMTNASSTLHAAGNTFEQSVALLTAANTTIQDAAKSSTGLRTIAARIRNTKTELDDLGEVMTEASYEELVQTLTDCGVALTDINGEYRSTYDIMSDIAAKWDALDSMRQAALATALSGTRQQAVFYSIIENFQEASGAMESMADSSGALGDAYDVYLNSARAHIDQFKASFQELSANIFGSDLIKWVVELGTGILDLLTGITQFIEKIGGLKTVLIGLTSVLLMTKSAWLAMKIQMLATAVISKLTTALTAIKTGFLGMIMILRKAGAALMGFVTKTTTLKAAMSAIVPAIGVIGLAFTAVIAVISALNSAEEENIETEEDAKNAHESTAKSMLDEANAVESLRDEYLSIIDSGDTYADKLAALHEWQDKIIAQYGLEEEAIRKVNLARADGIQILDAEILRKRREAIAEATAGYQDAQKTLDTYVTLVGGADAVSDKYDELLQKYGYTTIDGKTATRVKKGPLDHILSLPLDEAYSELVDFVNKYSNCLDTLSEEDRAFYDVAAEYLAAISETYRSASAIVEQYEHMVAEADFLEEKHMFGYVHTQADYDALLQRLRQRAWDKWDSETDFKMVIELLDGTVVQYGGEYEDLLVSILQEYYPQFAKATDFVMNNAKKSNERLVKNLAETLGTTEQIIKDSFTDEEIVLGAQLVGKGDISSVEELRDALTEYNSDAAVAARRTEALRGVIDMLWSSEGFESAREELTGIVKQYGKISPEKIVELAEESDLLASILKEDGMNARFLAQVLSSLASGGDGLAIITTNALMLNDALNGMSDAFYGVTEAKEKYDAAMQTPEKDESFKSYADAYKTLMEQFEAGTTNSNAFWASAEYLFGAEQLAEWGYADGLTEIKSAAEGIGLVFADADSAGAGLIHKLYAMSEAGKLVNEEGEQLMTISKDAEGGFVFDVDPSNLPAIAEKLNITEDALVACFQALSMWGNVDFYDINEVMTAIEEIGLAAETTGGKAINVSRLTEQLLSLGLTNKEIYDVLQKLQALDGVTLFGVTEDIDKLKGELIDLGLAADDGVTVNVDYEGLTNLMSQLGFTKEEAQETINLLGAADGITLTNASGEVKSVDDALAHIDTLTFATVTENVSAIGDAVEDVDGSSTDNATSEIDAIGAAAETAAQKVYSIGTAMDDINGKTTTVYYEVKRKGAILDIFGFAKGTSSAPGGPAVVGEEGAELQITDGAARIVGANGPEIVNVNKGDRIYTAEETQEIMRRSGRNIHGIIPAYATGKVSGSTPDIPVPDTDAWRDGGKNSGKNSSSNSSKDNEETWFERQYKDHKHWLEMDKESTEDYLKWLDDAYKQAYEEGIIDIDEYYKYQEEVYKGLQDLFKDYLNDVEHEISMRENYDGESDKIISMYEKLMDDVEKEIASARAHGLDDTDDYIQELQKKWQGYYDSVTDIRESAEEDAKDAIDELVDYRIDMIKQEIDDEKDALDKKLDNLKEFYDKQKEMLQDVYDEEKYLDEQSEKRKSVTDIQAELARLEFDDSAWAQKRKLQLQQELADAQKELEDFEKQHALDEALGLLDDAYDAQEKDINAEMEALEEKLNDPEALYNQALADIRNNTEELYQEMLEYNRRHGTGNDEDVTDMWEDAYKALLEYHDIYGEWYNGIDLGNYTGYEEPQESWDTAPISESGSQTQPEQPPAPTQPSTPETPVLTDSIKKHVAAAIWNGNYGWGNGSTRDNRLTEVFGSNNGIQAIVNKGYQYVAGTSPSGYSYTDMRKKFKGYASGTRKAAPGMHAVDELGAEYLFTSADGNRYRVFSGGEKVLNAKATEFLYEFANSGKDILEKIAKSFIDTSSLDRIRPIVNNNEIHMGDITIQGNATQSTVSEIRRAQRESLENMLREFNRLNK